MGSPEIEGTQLFMYYVFASSAGTTSDLCKRILSVQVCSVRIHKLLVRLYLWRNVSRDFTSEMTDTLGRKVWQPSNGAPSHQRSPLAVNWVLRESLLLRSYPSNIHDSCSSRDEADRKATSKFGFEQFIGAGCRGWRGWCFLSCVCSSVLLLTGKPCTFNCTVIACST